jgi:hypothetical protein
MPVVFGTVTAGSVVVVPVRAGGITSRLALAVPLLETATATTTATAAAAAEPGGAPAPFPGPCLGPHLLDAGHAVRLGPAGLAHVVSKGNEA